MSSTGSATAGVLSNMRSLQSVSSRYNRTDSYKPAAPQGNVEESSSAMENGDDDDFEKEGSLGRSHRTDLPLATVPEHGDGHIRNIFGSNKSTDHRTHGEIIHDIGMHPVVRKMQRVIFPDRRWIKIWDSVMLMLLIYVAFVVPYSVGVSGGWRLLISDVWLAFNFIINLVFVVDTILYFFRAYRDPGGKLVFDLSRIRRRYLRTLFIPNVISSLPTSTVYYIYLRRVEAVASVASNHENRFDNMTSTTSVAIKLMELLKLIRLLRMKEILTSSNVIRDLQQRNRSYILLTAKYVFLIMVTSHWFACIWCFTVYSQVKSFDEDDLLENPNWLTYWHSNYYSEGGLNPFGWENDLSRYVLSLFWAIQTITGIGYGNIVPLTFVEWWIGSIMQLIAGIIWAYVIGGLVGVAVSMDPVEQKYRDRKDQANELIKEFSTHTRNDTNMDKSARQSNEISHTTQSIRTYLSDQKMKCRNAGFTSNLAQRFPVIENLSPQLQRMSSLLVGSQHLEAIPYISSRFLSSVEQSYVTEEFIYLEYPGGENIKITNRGIENLGRGVLFISEGTVSCVKSKGGKNSERIRLLSGGSVIGADEVLVETSNKILADTADHIFFLTYTKLTFISQNSIRGALFRNPKAWKDCARWKYLKILILLQTVT